jgi:hypothetical protein
MSWEMRRCAILLAVARETVLSRGMKSVAFIVDDSCIFGGRTSWYFTILFGHSV